MWRKPKHEKELLNLRAELWFAVKDWLADVIADFLKMMSFLGIGAYQYKYTSTGKIKIESKDEMRKRGIKSPDKAVALALTMASSAASFGGSQSYLGYNFKKPLKSRIFRVG